MVTDKRKLALLHRTLQFELSGIVEFGIVGGVCGLHAVGVFWTWSGVTSLEHQVTQERKAVDHAQGMRCFALGLQDANGCGLNCGP